MEARCMKRGGQMQAGVTAATGILVIPAQSPPPSSGTSTVQGDSTSMRPGPVFEIHVGGQ
jgi:hypothetical protein